MANDSTSTGNIIVGAAGWLLVTPIWPIEEAGMCLALKNSVGLLKVTKDTGGVESLGKDVTVL